MTMSDTSEKKIYRWKGKIVTKKVYKRMLFARKNFLKRKKVKLNLNVTDNVSEKNEEKNEPTCAEGILIVELRTLGELLWCVSCKEALSLQYIENTTRRGLSSQLLIRCHKCLILNEICTGECDKSNDVRSIRFATNCTADSATCVIYFTMKVKRKIDNQKTLHQRTSMNEKKNLQEQIVPVTKRCASGSNWEKFKQIACQPSVAKTDSQKKSLTGNSQHKNKKVRKNKQTSAPEVISNLHSYSKPSIAKTDKQTPTPEVVNDLHSYGKPSIAKTDSQKKSLTGNSQHKNKKVRKNKQTSAPEVISNLHSYSKPSIAKTDKQTPTPEVVNDLHSYGKPSIAKTDSQEKSLTRNSQHKNRRIKKHKETPAPEVNQAAMFNNSVNNNQPNLTKEIAMDCEMVGIGDGTESMIARVSIVNRFCVCLYDKYVKPREKVIDFRTAVSGIRPSDLQKGEDFTIVQKEVADILKGRVLVGHALMNDLRVLFLSHPKSKLRDTSRYKRFHKMFNCGTPSLKKLARELLGKNIQTGEHSSVEDAIAAMQLYMLFKNEWEADIHHK